MQDVIAIVACGGVAGAADVVAGAVVAAVVIAASFFVPASGFDIAPAFAFDAGDCTYYWYGGLNDAFLVDQSLESKKIQAALVFDCEDRRGNSHSCSLHDNRIRHDFLQLSPSQELDLFVNFD